MQVVFLVKKSVLYRDNPLRLYCAHAANCYFKRCFEQAKTPNIHDVSDANPRVCSPVQHAILNLTGRIAAPPLPYQMLL
jgi:hypothetical protein